MEQRTAFSRAWALLDSHGRLIWTARICAVVAALMTVGLLAVVALLVDLLISQGRIPSFAELNSRHREAFVADLPQFDGDRRAQALSMIGASEAVQKQLQQPFDQLSAVNREQLWRGYVADMLNRRVGTEAASVYATLAKTTDPAFTSGLPGLGSLSLVVRSFSQSLHGLFGWMASWNPWSWRPGTSAVPNNNYLTGLLYLALVFGLIRAVMMNLGNAAAATAGLAVSLRLRRALYHHSYRLGTLMIQNTGASRVAALFHRHCDAVSEAVRESLSNQLFGAIELIVLLAFALLIHFWLALAFVIMAVIVALVGGQMTVSFRRRARRADRRAAARMQLLHESLGMMRLVKSHVMELFNQSRVERQLAELAVARARRIRAEALHRPMLWFLALVAAAILLYIASLLVLSGGIGTAQVIVLAATVVCITWPARSLLKHRRLVRIGQDSAVLIYEFLDRPPEMGQVVGADFLTEIDEGIEFREVTLREPHSGRQLLDGVNLSIGAGERIGLVGHHEAEKHAFVYLLARILDPTEGEIAIDGKDLKDLTLESLRNQICLVLQSHLVFSDTVANNISCGEVAYSMPQIIEAAKLAHAHQFVQRLPYGYETPLGDLGTTLRPGEQFRIGLARAILRDPAMFIIEEPALPLDEETKDLLDDSFDRVLPGKTVLFLPHRISTIRSCDRLCLIHNGKVEAVGEHRDLVTTSDLYKHLHYLEFNEFADKV